MLAGRRRTYLWIGPAAVAVIVVTIVELHTQNGVHMVAAPGPVISGAPGKDDGLVYGRYVIRFEADPVPGYKPAWLLWPDSNDWSDAEIDFPEGISAAHSMLICITEQIQRRRTPTRQAPHIPAGIRRLSGGRRRQSRFIFDGKEIGSSTNASTIPRHPRCTGFCKQRPN